MSYWKHKHVQSTGVTTVSISSGVLLHGFVLNQKSTAATSTSLVTIYDATTTLASTAAGVVGICDIVGVSAADYMYDAELDNGLVINVGAGAAPVDLTVLYR